MELTEHLHLVTTKVVKMDSLLLRTLLGSMRIKVRLLSDLGQLNGNQWCMKTSRKNLWRSPVS